MPIKNPLTPAVIKPAIFRFVTQHLNNCATAVTLPNIKYVLYYILLYF